MKSRLIFFPPLQTQGQVNDLVARCGWYFYPYLDQISDIVLFCAKDMATNCSLPDEFDGEIEDRRKRVLAKITTVSSESNGTELLRQFDPKSDCLFVWNTASELLKSKAVRDQFNAARAKGRYYEVDPQNTRMEGSFYLWAGLNTFCDKGKLVSKNRRKFFNFYEKNRNSSKTYVFGTGPTLSEFCEKHDFSDGSCIIANSMVKNERLLEQLRPIAIVAGDPIFHAGCSRYAGEFRRELLKAMSSTDAFLIVPLRDYNIYVSYLPDSIHERVIGVPYEAKRPYTVDLSKDFFVSPLANILTLFLLPVASSISKEINIVGCDGRPLDQSQYFWRHDRASQFNAEMDNIKQVHRGFFEIDYNDYYLGHCESVKSAAEALEAAGRRVVSLTPSYVPALADRYVQDRSDSRLSDRSDPEAPVGTVIAIDPDAMDHFGHFLSYDARMAEAVREKGLRFSVFGNAAFDMSCLPETIDEFVPVFTVKSWTIGNTQGGPLSHDVETFRSELTKAVDTLSVGDRSRLTMLYMYCGSLEHAEIIYRLLEGRENILANVNLFWSYAFDESRAEYIHRWAPFLHKAAGSRWLILTLPTTKLQTDFVRYFGVHLPVAPHPSTTFSDKEASHLAQLPWRHAPSRPVIMFPGGMREEKGFALSVQAALLLSDSGGVDCVVRGLVTPGSMREMQRELARLVGSKVAVESREFDDRQFREFLGSGDVVVCPYLAPDFSRRTSGLVIDAMLLGRPVVVLEDTWLGDITTDLKVGVVSGPTPKKIFDSVNIVLNNYEDITRSISEANLKYLSEHSWGILLDSIVSPRERPRILTPAAEILAKHSAANARGAKAVTYAQKKSRASRYERVVLWARRNHPVINRIGQFTMRTLRTARRYPGRALGLVAVFAALVVGGFLMPSPAYAIVVWTLAALLALGFLLAFAVPFRGHLMQQRVEEMKSRLSGLERRLHAVESRNHKGIRALREEFMAPTDVQGGPASEAQKEVQAAENRQVAKRSIAEARDIVLHAETTGRRKAE